MNEKDALPMKKKQVDSVVYYAAFLFIILFGAYRIFKGLSSAPIFDWDEARHGINAFEMVQSGNYLAQTYLGELDYWNLKPPLSFLAICLSYKLFGFSAFSLRFFSAIAFLLTTIGMIVFLSKVLDRMSGLVSGLVFVLIAPHFNHLFYSGDADALFFLFVFISIASFILSYIFDKKFLILSGLGLSLTFLTKSFHVLFLIVILFFIWITFIKSKKISFFDLIKYMVPPTLLPILIWAAFRFQVDGLTFFKEMFLTDVFKRASSVSDGNSGNWLYYIMELKRVMGSFFLFTIGLLLLSSLDILFFEKQKPDFNTKIILTSGFITSLTPLLLYSLMSTKLSWYVWPSMIGFILLIAGNIHYLICLWKKSAEEKKERTFVKVAFVFLSICLLISVNTMNDRYLTQIGYDTSTLYPTASFFNTVTSQYKEGEELKKYILVDVNNNPESISQSWILQGLYKGYQYIDLSKIDTMDSIECVILKYNSFKELNVYLQQHPDLSLSFQEGNYAFLEVAGE